MAHSVVIGGAGFVGSWVVDEILKDPNNRVTIIDNLISSERWNISTDPRVEFVQGSAAESATFDKISGPVDFLYQLACFHGNQSSIARPIDDLENGLKTTLVSLEWVKNNSPRTKVIYSGAGCAVAKKTWVSPEPIKEIDETSLLHDSPYSISKITGEMYCTLYAHLHGINVVRVRFQNVYGPREILGAGIWRGTSNTIWRNVIPGFIWKALLNQDLEIFGYNRAGRDFIYVEDIARGCVLAAKYGERGDVYNLATEIETRINELAQLIVELTTSQSKIIQREARVWDNSGRRLGSKEKSMREIKFEALRPLEEGLVETIIWTDANAGKIAKSIDKHKKQR